MSKPIFICKSNAVKPTLFLPNKTSHDYFIKGIYENLYNAFMLFFMS